MFSYGRLSREDAAMMASNIFFLSPIIISGIYGEWLYLAFAGGIMLFSPFFHWYRIVAQYSRRYWVFRVLDWVFAGSAFLYMYWYTHQQLPKGTAELIYALLSAAIVFFLYGWKYGDYRTLHPWFHFVAATLSSIILIAAH